MLQPTRAKALRLLPVCTLLVLFSCDQGRDDPEPELNTDPTETPSDVLSDDDTTAGDDDVTGGDDDTTIGDDDTTVGDDDITAGDDDVTVGDDDTSTGDDDATVGDDDTSEDRDGDGYSIADGDCDDNDFWTYPSAPERDDGKDNDCDGTLDEGVYNNNDVDADGYYGAAPGEGQPGSSTGTNMGEGPLPDHTPSPDPCAEADAEPTTLYVSADDSNSQADPAHVRQIIEYGSTVRGSLRLYEFLNFYTFGYPAAEPGHVRVVPQLRPVEGEEGTYVLLVGVVAPYVPVADRSPLNLTFSIDRSGSMSGHAIAMVQDTLRVVAGSLRAGDVISMVSWETTSEVILDSLEVEGPNDPVLVAAIEALQAGGSTNFHQGLVTAYSLADKNFDPDYLNRVFLMSDGGANTGPTDEDLIASYAEDGEQDGIYLIGVGATTDPYYYRDQLMDTVTDLGKGAYLFVDRLSEAERSFSGERFVSNLDIAARNVRLEMTMPPGFVLNEEEFHGEEVSENPEEVTPQHLAPNDAMLYHMELIDCDRIERAGSDTFQFTVTWQDPETRHTHYDEVSMSLEALLTADDTELRKANAIIAYADALTEVWDYPESAQRVYLDAVYADIESLYAETGDKELEEILGLLDIYREHF